MNKVKVFYKIQTIILLAILVSLIACFTVGTAFADSELPVVNLENCDEQIEEGDLTGYAGVITDLDCVKQNKKVFASYIESDNGKVLLPNRDNDSNVLAYQIIGFSEKGIVTYPIYTYSKIDKSCVNYNDLLKDDSVLISENDKNTMLAATDDNYSDYMFVEVSFCVYSKKSANNYVKIGAVRLRMTIDYFPTDNPNYNSYVSRYEVCVTPTNKATLKSFNMTPLYSDEVRVDTSNVHTNHEAATTTRNFTFNTGIESKKGLQIGVSDASVSVDKGGMISMSFGYSISVPEGATSVVQKADVKRLDQFYGSPLQVTRSGRSNSMWSTHLRQDLGKTYSGLYYATHRIQKDQNGGCLGLLFSDLSLWGTIGEPSYDEGNAEKVLLIATWENNFSNKMIMVLDGDAGNNQYFDDSEAHSSLTGEGSIGGILIFREE